MDKILRRTKVITLGFALFISLSTSILTFFLSFPMMETNKSNLMQQQFVIGQSWYRVFTSDNITYINGLGIFFFILSILLLRLSYWLFYQE